MSHRLLGAIVGWGGRKSSASLSCLRNFLFAASKAIDVMVGAFSLRRVTAGRRENLVPCPSKQLVIISALEYKPGEDVKTCNKRVSELILRKHMAVSFQVPTDINS